MYLSKADLSKEELRFIDLSRADLRFSLFKKFRIYIQNK